MGWLAVQWSDVFDFEMSVLELFVRGTAVYLFVFTLFRVLLKRQAGSLSVTDLLVVVFVADAGQNAMAAEYRTVPEGLLLMLVIAGWAFALDWAAMRFKWFERVVRPRPLLLVRDGELLRQNMRRELISTEELLEQLRLQGVDDVAEVKTAFMEATGHISVIKNDGHV